ncbi:hypothetical protein HYFRA_00007884 [Hymenoscyphus fraxineus]|uniref:Uncharacterized protein n=1 Tax=Hymenoscyphus fraxineus TaxID=746836 RepID=A0A9N9KPA9_9HELO|nr:hypothetical protein HYFRA_00007884 [Hymenoscyphus fraxineus]
MGDRRRSGVEVVPFPARAGTWLAHYYFSTNSKKRVNLRSIGNVQRYAMKRRTRTRNLILAEPAILTYMPEKESKYLVLVA